MLKIKPMQLKDYTFAVDLANTMDWQMATEDFEFMAALEPEGCLVAYLDAKPVGIATCLGYGTLGWFGNLIGQPQYRKRGIATQLVNHAITYLRGKGVRTIGLYAYPHLTGFYGGLGFKQDLDFTLLRAEKLGAINAEKLPKISRRQLATVEALDRCCFGGDRKKLLNTIIQDPDNLSACLVSGAKVVGYVAATVYEHAAWLGPLTCQSGNEEGAAALINAVLAELSGKAVYAVAPKDSPLQNLFATLGFRVQFWVARMYLGVAPLQDCIYLAESLERG
jgi:predicted N-acetyltransferase YhbS